MYNSTNVYSNNAQSDNTHSHVTESKGSLTGRTIFGLGLAGLALITAACAAPIVKPDFYPTKGDSHTKTYTDKTGKDVTVIDLSGDWTGTGYMSGTRKVRIKQEGTTFTGVMTDPGEWINMGQETLRGHIIDGNVIYCENFNTVHAVNGSNVKVDKSVELFTCEGHGMIRTYKKIK